MNKDLFGIPHFDAYAVLGILILFGLAEILLGYLKRSKRSSGDWMQEAGAFVILSALTKPAIVFVVYFVGGSLFPDATFTFSELNIWFALAFYLLIDDFMQYWYHRSAHEYQWLWKLHRPHHQAEEMGFFVAYRNAALYYFLMPNIWWIAAFTFLGGGKAVAIGLILKQVVIIGAHSPTKWDRVLYKFPILSPLTSFVERIIVTPAFHFSHHGKSMIDDVSDPNGNYGNMFSIWDQAFNTAKFTRKYPTELGLVNDPKEVWAASYLYPFIKSSNSESELSKGYQKQPTTLPEPTIVDLIKGQNYLWCQCGLSKNQPFCDGSHHGTKKKPLLFRAKKTSGAKFCNCKLTRKGPFCDNSHLKITDETKNN